MGAHSRRLRRDRESTRTEKSSDLVDLSSTKGEASARRAGRSRLTSFPLNSSGHRWASGSLRKRLLLARLSQ